MVTQNRHERPLALIFDLDGTLVDSGLDIALSVNFVRVHFRLPELPLSEVFSYIGDGVVRLLERALAADSQGVVSSSPVDQVPADRLTEGLAVFRQYYGKHLLDHTGLYPGVREVLARFADVPLFLATNKPRVYTDQILQGLQIATVFRNIVAGDETTERKPEPAHLRQTLHGLQVKPSQVVMVGDSPNDVNAARAFGAVSVGCTFGLVDKEIVAAARPDYLIDDISGLLDLCFDYTSVWERP